MPLFLHFAIAFSTAAWTFGNSLAAPMDGDVQLIGLGFEFGFTMGADIGMRHQANIRDNKDQRNGDRNVVPRHLGSIAKPIHRTRGEGESQEH